MAAANAFQYLNLATFLILVIGTLGVKVLLHILGQRSDLDSKLFSHFALLIKNVPLYYQLDDLKTELAAMVSNINIQEVFHCKI